MQDGLTQLMHFIERFPPFNGLCLGFLRTHRRA